MIFGEGRRHCCWCFR